MRIFGIAGQSGMGKTTLLERLIPELTGRGLLRLALGGAAAIHDIGDLVLAKATQR